MSIVYATLFTRIGKLIKWTNSFITYQGTTLLGSGSGADEILDQYNDRRDLVTGLEDQFISSAAQVAAWSDQLKSYVDRTLQDLQADLSAPSNSLNVILPLLVADMIANSQSVNASAVSTPTATAGGSNTGNGQLLVSKVNADGLDDERAIVETVKLVCTSDQFTGGTAGLESFSMTGLPSYPAGDYHARGNGSGPTLSVSPGVLLNGDFESFSTANTPDSWTIDAGTAGTTILEENTILHAADSTSSLKLHGNATAATITLSQVITDLVTPSTRYAVGVWVRKNGTFGAGVSNLQISVKGTGFVTVNLFNADPSTLTTSFALKSGWINIPAAIPADLRVEITWTDADHPDSGAEIVLDDFALILPVEFGHTLYALFRGSADFIADDTWSVATSNDYGGVIQTYFNRFYDTLLPSNAAAGETIADALAT